MFMGRRIQNVGAAARAAHVYAGIGFGCVEMVLMVPAVPRSPDGKISPRRWMGRHLHSFISLAVPGIDEG
jgi:hypothetical protein